MKNDMQPEWEREVRDEIVEMGQRLHMLGLVAGCDGNLSCRLDDNRILITPSGYSLGFLKPNKLVTVDMKGQILYDPQVKPYTLRPSAEMKMHLEVYRQRPDVNAVIHAHPPMSIACTIAQVSLTTCVLPEIMYHLGPIPTAPYAMPGTAERAKSIRQFVKYHDAMLLDRHGTLTVGDTLFTAMMRLEWVEQASKVMLAVKSAMGKTEHSSLPVEQTEQLQVMRSRKLARSGRWESRRDFDVYAPFILNQTA